MLIAIAIMALTTQDVAPFTRIDLFPPYPQTVQVEKLRAKSKRVLYKDLKCLAWLSSRGVDAYRLHTIIDQAKFIDGPATTMPVNWIGTFHDMPERPFNEWLAATGLRPALVQGRHDGRLLILVYKADGLKTEHVIHEALHFYYNDDDPRLAARLGVAITSADTTPISREIGKYCR